MASENPRNRKHINNEVEAASSSRAVVEAGTADHAGNLQQLKRVDIHNPQAASSGTTSMIRDQIRTQDGNNYTGISLSDQTRAHLGNVYATNYNATHLPDHSAKEEGYKGFMRALAFDQMDFRLAAIESAYAQTCQWILNEESFLRWRDPAFRDANHGFFWIKGKPGSGKSTLVKCILKHLTHHAPEHKIVSFFFNARGEPLERSTEGCYRSLLHQMLQQIPSLRESLRIPYGLGHNHAWPVAVLRDLFRETVLHLQEEHLILIVDALDECDQNEVRDMVHFLGGLAESSRLSGVVFNICFASRHYPSIAVRFCENFVVEKSNKHTHDIEEYARDNLNIEVETQRQHLLSEVIRRSEGVFLWVVLVVRMLNEQFDQGAGHSQLLEAVSALPEDLDALIGSIISRGARDQYLLPTLLWILSGTYDTTLEQLYLGIKLGAGELSLEHPNVVDPATMTRFILHASRGLVESTSDIDKKWYGEKHPFQFIHESIRQHIIAGGLAGLNPRLSSNVEATGHAFIAEWCQDYIRLPWEFSPTHPDVAYRSVDTSERLFGNHPLGPADHNNMIWSGPFSYYVLDSIFHYVEFAYCGGAYDLERLHIFPLQDLVSIFILRAESYDWPVPSKPSVSLLSILISRLGHSEMAKGLIEHCLGCSTAVQDCRRGSEPTRVSCYDFMLGRCLQGCGNNIRSANDLNTSLIAAAYHGLMYIVILLLDLGADVNFSGGNGPSTASREYGLCTPLAASARPGSDAVAIAKLLLDRGARVNARCHEHGSALGAAVYNSNKEVIELLVDRGADINLEYDLRDGRQGNIALREAIWGGGDAHTFGLLLRIGAHGIAGTLELYELDDGGRFDDDGEFHEPYGYRVVEGQ